MAGVAFLTYNRICADPFSSPVNGWHYKGQAFVLQGDVEGVKEFVEKYGNGAPRRRALIDLLWPDLVKNRRDLTAAVIYVGHEGSERVIELAARLREMERKNQWEPLLLAFVICGCRYEIHRDEIQRYNLEGATLIHADCNGFETMSHIFKSFMESGHLPFS